MNLNEFMVFVDKKHWQKISMLLVAKIRSIHKAGAEFAAIASNTPHIVFDEIELGIFRDSTREELLAVVKRMVDENGIDSLILGCTELPLILTEGKYGIPFLNTSSIHCESIIKYCIE